MTSSVTLNGLNSQSAMFHYKYIIIFTYTHSLWCTWASLFWWWEVAGSRPAVSAWEPGAAMLWLCLMESWKQTPVIRLDFKVFLRVCLLKSAVVRFYLTLTLVTVHHLWDGNKKVQHSVFSLKVWQRFRNIFQILNTSFFYFQCIGVLSQSEHPKLCFLCGHRHCLSFLVSNLCVGTQRC